MSRDSNLVFLGLKRASVEEKRRWKYAGPVVVICCIAFAALWMMAG